MENGLEWSVIRIKLCTKQFCISKIKTYPKNHIYLLITKFLLGLLKDRKKDLGVSPFTLKQSRASVVDYLPTLMAAYEQFFIRNPAEAYDWVAYTLPLTREAWLAIVVFSILIPLIMGLAMTKRK